MANKKPVDYQSLSLKLDELVAKLQDENTTIDKSIELYEEATKLIAQMEAYLKTAENRLRKVVPKAKAS
jgi:exodeoxyribonuclease VII small subunit